MKNIALVISVLLSAVVVIHSAVFAAGSVRISGASTIFPIMDKAAPIYRSTFNTDMMVKAGGSGIGVAEAINGQVDIGMVSRALKDSEKEKLNYTTIGLDALAIIVDKHNPITEIDKNTVIKIYRGEITSWSVLANYERPIALVSKEVGRSTLELFEEYTGLKSAKRSDNGKNGKIVKEVYEIGSNLEALTLVGGIPGAIGYVSVGTALKMQAKGMPIKMLKVDQVEPSKDNILNKRYPIVRELNIVYLKTAEQKDFLDFMASPKVQKIIEDEGFLLFTR